MKALAYAAWLRKGLVGLAGAAAAYGLATIPASPGGTGITTVEWVQIGVAGLVAAGVIVVTNGPKPQ